MFLTRLYKRGIFNTNKNNMGNKEKLNTTHEIIENNVFISTEWQENITELDLSNREISNLDENVKLPPNLTVLNLSRNELVEIPIKVLKLEGLKTLDLSHNKIVLCDDTPSFCHTLENLNLSNNKLQGPPYWVWTENPKKLVNLNLSYNDQLCKLLDDYYLEELLQYTTSVQNIDLNNCRLDKHKRLLSTFKHAKILKLGHFDYSYMSVNHLENVPCAGLEDCCDIEVLNVCNTHIYNIQHNIDIYIYLKEINLSQNNINSLPNEFCNLKNLEVCILSSNRVLYLPDDVHKLTKLIKLYLDNNELCMVPDTLTQLCNLKTLDLYSNHLYEGVDDVTQFEEYDFAQNYSDEPNAEDYLEKKRKIRQNNSGRLDGRVSEIVNEESEKSEVESYDEESIEAERQANKLASHTRCSTPEDWDSDEYWVPSQADLPTKPILTSRHENPNSPNFRWLNFVHRKMAEGNFCPMDMHLSISITEKVMLEKLHDPQPVYESDGQFDDYSDDDT